MEVCKLKPAVKSYIWGGNYFKKYFDVKENIVSELWVLSTREDSSIIDSGINKGKLLKDIIKEEDIGPISKEFPYFPLLIKLIDAKENLSVQVHPSDEYALKNENSFGKTEMWYVLDNDEGAGLYVGLNNNYSKEEIEEKLKKGTILEALNFYPVNKGEVYLINSGTIHAIGAGVRIIEIQQNSDLTYRLYDYKRKDKNGNERELHIDKALKVIDYKKYENGSYFSNNTLKTPYFDVKVIEVDDELVLKANKKSFISFTVIEGNGEANNIKFTKFDTFFIPYNKECLIKGKAKIIVSSL